MIYDAQAIMNPDLRGYAGSGSAEKQRLQHAFQLYINMPALILDRPEFRGLPPDQRQRLLELLDLRGRADPQIASAVTRNIPAVGRALDAAKQERDRLVQENPALAAYLTYRKSQGDAGTLEDFLENQWPAQRGR